MVKVAKSRKTSSYNVYRSYLKRRGTHLSTEQLSASWTMANKENAPDGAVLRRSFSKEIDRLTAEMTRKEKDAEGNDVTTPPTREKLLDMMSKTDSQWSKQFDQEFSDYLKTSGIGDQINSEIKRGEYKTTDGGAFNVPSGENPTGDGSGSSPFGLGDILKNAATGATVGSVNNSSGSSTATNMGNLNTLTGNFVRSGQSLNAGGGTVDTRVSSDIDIGDSITQGPGSTQTGTKSLRPKFPIAGGDAVKGTVVEEATSNVIFESFSVVPSGHGLGIDNALDKLNQANDFVRFGIGPLSHPRTYDPENGIKPEIATWNNDQEPEFIVAQVKAEADAVMASEKAEQKQLAQPESFIMDGEDYVMEVSSQTLPSHRPEPYRTVYNNQRMFLPSTTPAGLFLSNIPFRTADGRSARRGEL
jgi:hypothetical protein